MIVRCSSCIVSLESDSKIAVTVSGSGVVVVVGWKMESILFFTVSLIVCPMLFNVFPILSKTERLARRLLPCAAHVKAASSKSTLRKR